METKLEVMMNGETYSISGVTMEGTTLVNLSSTDKCLATNDGIITIPASGISATLRKSGIGMQVSNLPFTVTRTTISPINIPDKQPGVIYLVEENIARETNRLDVYYLSGLHVDENGKSLYTEIAYY